MRVLAALREAYRVAIIRGVARLVAVVLPLALSY